MISLPFHIAWFETKVRYARSVLGPFWITIQTAVFVIAIGYLMAGVFGSDTATYMSYFSVSYVMWNFFSGSILESASTFTNAASFIRDRAKKPRTFILVPFARQIVYLAHTIIIPIAIFVFLGVSSPLNVLMAIPGFILFLLATLLITGPVGVFCVRFRDGRPVIESGMTLLFLIAPILWPPHSVKGRAQLVLDLNPLAHLLAVWREPLMNGTIPWGSFLYVIVFDLVLAALFYFSLVQSKRVPLWL